MRCVTALFVTTAMAVAAPAFAAEAPAGEALADEAAPAPADASAGAEIVVFGAGQTRQVQEISNADLTLLAAGTSPLRVLVR